MNKFPCAINDRAAMFCLEIAGLMTQLFGISDEEAIGRVNQHWAGIKIGGPEELVYREDAEFWAKTIYFTSDSYWWLDWWLAENTPKPKPFVPE